MADYLDPIVAKLEGDHSDLTRKLATSKQEVKTWATDVGKTKVTLSVDAKLKDGTLDALRQKVKDSAAAKLDVELRLKTGTVTALRGKVGDSAAAKLDVSATLKTGTLTALRREISDSAAAKLDTALRLKDGTLAAIRQQVKDAAAAKLSVQLDLDSVQADAVRATLEANAVEVKVKPKMDQLAQRRVATILMEFGKRIDVSVRPTVDTAAALNTQRRLDRLTRDRTVLIRTRTIGGGNPSSSSSNGSGGGMLAAVLPYAPALVPIAAAATNVAASIGAATVAVGAFGLAVYPQAKQLSGMSAAIDTLAAAQESGAASSKKAVAAQQKALAVIDGAPEATKRAAVGFGLLRNDFTKWSDSLAKFTMDPVTKSFAVAEAVLPKLSPMVKGTSDQLNRLITMAGGEVATPGFDAMSKRFADFADGALKHATDDVVHFSRVIGEGSADGPVSQFMQYAKDQGPAVKQTLEDIAKAVSTVVQGSADAGPGMLTLVDAVAKLVASLPPEFVGRVLQAYAAFKLFKLANSGVTTLTGQVTNLSGRLVTLRATSAAAGGGIAGTRAAIASLSTGTKVAGAIVVVAGLALALKHFSDEGKKANISADSMATSLKGIASGDAGSLSKMLEQLSKDGDNLHQSFMQKVKSNDSVWDIVTDSGKKTSSAKKDFNELGQTLADMVKNGDASTAAAALDKLNAAGVKVPTKYLKDYNSALADAAFESKLAAESQGTFGQQAVAVQRKLDLQKQAAQGLQQAILDLNDANRAGMDAMSDYQQAIDDGTKALKTHGVALKFTNGEYDANTQGSRDAYTAMSKVASTAEAAAVAAVQQGKGQDYANGILVDAHGHLVQMAKDAGASSSQAKHLANELDNIHDPKIQISVAKAQAEADIASAKKSLASLPTHKTAALRADATQLKNVIRDAQARINALSGKSIVIHTTYTTSGNVAHEGGGYATGALIASNVRRMAQGGMGRPAMMAKGGSNVLWGEGPDESYIPHDRRPRSKAIAEQTVGIMGGSVNWGGSAGVGGNVASGLAKGISGGQGDVVAAAIGMGRAAIAAFSDELGIASPSKKFRALGAYVISGLVQGLTGTTPQVKAAAKKIANTLYVDFGDSHKALQKGIAKDNAKLLSLASQRDGVATKLKAAQSKLAALQKSSAAEKAAIASGIMQNESIITASPDAGRAVNTDDVLAQMRTQVAAAKQFAVELDQLRKKGLSSTLIAQLAAAGVDQAGATALALSAGSKSQIDQMNSMQSSLQTAANATGSAVADSMYGAGIKSAQGLVKGLKAQEKAIDAEMLRIAKAMQKAIKKALGIRSPSAVMAEVGDYTAQGMALGINRSGKHAVIAARGMAMAVRQGATLTGGSLAGAVSGGRGGGEVHYHFSPQITVQGSVVTERKLIEVVRTGVLQGARRNPNNGLSL